MENKIKSREEVPRLFGSDISIAVSATILYMASNANHCSFVLLAEFHIHEGAQLKYQFPQPLGIDER